MSDVVKLAIPTVGGARLVQSSGGVWYKDHPRLIKPVQLDRELSAAETINGVLDMDGYPTAAECSGGNPDSYAESGVIVSYPDMDVKGHPLTLKLRHG